MALAAHFDIERGKDLNLRALVESDYQNVISVLDEWWGGRHMADMLPKLFFKHFRETSFIVEEGGKIVGFLVGFVSQSYPTEAYIHFVGVHPDYRKKEIGLNLYSAFCDRVKQKGCKIVRSVTSPVNKGSIGFHTRLGFEIENGDMIIDGIPVYSNYDGLGEDRVLFAKRL